MLQFNSNFMNKTKVKCQYALFFQKRGYFRSFFCFFSTTCFILCLLITRETWQNVTLFPDKKIIFSSYICVSLDSTFASMLETFTRLYFGFIHKISIKLLSLLLSLLKYYKGSPLSICVKIFFS